MRERDIVFDISFPLEGLSGTVEQCMASPLLASAVKRDNQSYNPSARPKNSLSYRATFKQKWGGLLASHSAAQDLILGIPENLF